MVCSTLFRVALAIAQSAPLSQGDTLGGDCVSPVSKVSKCEQGIVIVSVDMLN